MMYFAGSANAGVRTALPVLQKPISPHARESASMPAADRHLTDWIRAMNQLREIDRRTEKGAAGHAEALTKRVYADVAIEECDGTRGTVDAATET